MSPRKRYITARRVVVKVGTYTLSDAAGRLDRSHMENLVEQIASLRAEGLEVILVSSGAIAAGVELLELPERPQDIPSLQAASSVGQGLLLHLYTSFFAARGILVGQVLFTQYDFAHRQQYLNARNAFRRLLEQGVVPLVNENDTVAVEEIRFGDNDRLAALVAVLTEADLLIMLSDIRGLFTADPKKDNAARLIHDVERITPEMIASAGKAGGRALFRGDERQAGGRAHRHRFRHWRGDRSGTRSRGAIRHHRGQAGRHILPSPEEEAARPEALDRLRSPPPWHHRHR